MKKISVILPCLNEAKNIPLLVPEIISAIPPSFDYEIIFVDDRSPDDSFAVIQALGNKNNKIKGICMYRRFGHQPSLIAGIKLATGDAVITMDADFQHPPKMITQRIEKWEQGYDLVQAQKKEDKTNNVLKRFIRSAGYKIWKNITDGLLAPGMSDFRLIDKKIVKFIIESQESEIFLRGLVQLAAHKPIYLPYTVGKRVFGSSSFTFKVLVNYFLNGFVSFSIKPLRIAWIMGLAIAIFTTLFLIIDMITAFFEEKSIIAGWLTVVLLILMLNGFTIFYLGILGEYIGVIFKEVKKRPQYLIEKKVNL